MALALALAFGASRAAAQEPPGEAWAVGGGAHAGYLLPQYGFLAAVADAPIASAEVHVSRRARGLPAWEEAYNYPAYGFSLFYSTLGNAEALGREVALTYFFRYYWRARGRLRVYNRLGVGGAYATRKFDALDNFRNVAIGTHLNIHFNARLGAEWRAGARTHLTAGVSFDHLSNANVTPVNRGLNYVTGYLGVRRGLGTARLAAPEVAPPAAGPRGRAPAVAGADGHLAELVASVGLRRPRSGVTARASTVAVAGAYRRGLNRAVSLGGGADLYLATDRRGGGAAPEAGSPAEVLPRWTGGVYLAAALAYHRFSWSLHAGVYVAGRPPYTDGPIYNRAVMQYALRDRYLLRVAMKSHLHILDFPEVGVGYRWRRR